jgi:hypothetical protein
MRCAFHLILTLDLNRTSEHSVLSASERDGAGARSGERRTHSFFNTLGNRSLDSSVSRTVSLSNTGTFGSQLSALGLVNSGRVTCEQ